MNFVTDKGDPSIARAAVQEWAQEKKDAKAKRKSDREARKQLRQNAKESGGGGETKDGGGNNEEKEDKNVSAMPCWRTRVREMNLDMFEDWSLSYEDFVKMVHDQRWRSLHNDVTVVQSINKFSKMYSKEPKHLTRKDIRAALFDNGNDDWNQLKRLLGVVQEKKEGGGETKESEEEKKEKGEETEEETIPLLFLCRFACLLNLNNKLRSLLPLIDLTLERAVSIDVVHENTDKATSANDADDADNADNADDTNTATTTATASSGFKYLSGYGELTSMLREIIFYTTKNHFWRSVLYHTTTQTLPPQSDGDKPESIPNISINMVSAGRERLERTIATNANIDGLDEVEALQAVFEQSVLGQLSNELESRGGRLLRRAWEDVQDAGQERSFYVKFIGEGVSDHGGPYRAVFQKACAEEPMTLGLVKKCGKGGKTEDLIELAYTQKKSTRGQFGVVHAFNCFQLLSTAASNDDCVSNWFFDLFDFVLLAVDFFSFSFSYHWYGTQVLNTKHHNCPKFVFLAN